MAPTSRASRRALHTPRATRTKARVSYTEPDSDSEVNSEDGYEDESVEETRTAAKSRRTTTRTPKRQRAAIESDDDLPPAKRKASKRNTPKPIAKPTVIRTSGVIPKWQQLPYQILVQIFQYASYPLYDQHNFQPLPSGSWLLKIARLCRAFAEPAFTVLYTSPPLVPMEKAHMLVDLLNTDPARLAFKYRQKVESLRIDVGQVAAYSLSGRGHLDLFSFVKHLPRLVELEFYHQKDMSPYRNLDESIKWSYPESLFDALEYIDPSADPSRGDKTSVCKLRSWRWSSRLAGKAYPIEKLREIHLKPSFSSLRKIAFVNYQIPYVRKGDEDSPAHEKILADSLLILTNLEHLIFESSTLVNAKLLPLLPKNLRNLELINCWEVIAEDFAEFLLTHGSQLRCLTLNHNQSLSLSFLPSLGSACPKLEVFRMNLTYFNLHATYRDSEPQYPQLLLPGEVPDWPSKLQTIELIQLRKWETEAAEMFFRSLLDSAATMPDLRRLTLQVILNIGWRDRASFRDKWVGSLERVFRRVCDPPERNFNIPSKHLDELDPDSAATRTNNIQGPSTARSSKLEVLVTPRKHDVRLPRKREASPQARRSTRTSTRQSYAESPENSDSEAQSQPSKRSQIQKSGISRELQILRATAGHDTPADALSPPTSASSAPSNLSDSDDDIPLVQLLKGDKGSQRMKGKQREVRQGMCEVVDIRIDNLRPRETQVTEADFLDEEQPGDRDWDGEDGEEEGYAW